MITNLKSSNNEIKNGLYLVSTPIGNLNDITFRAIEILKKSHVIVCEDTRVSKVLLNKYKIKSELISNHKFNEKKNVSKILDLLKNGLIISIISDAGTPVISDPGAILINKCIENKIDIIPIPGPSSVLTALSVSGFSDKFFFYGFFPESKKKIDNDLDDLSKLDYSIIFFISAKKINKVIPYLKEYFTGRKIIICKEMTKFYEEFLRFEIDDLNLKNSEIKGELTVVISEKINNKKKADILNEFDKKIINKMINKFSIKEIISLVNYNKKISKKEIYNYCVKLKNEI